MACLYCLIIVFCISYRVFQATFISERLVILVGSLVIYIVSYNPSSTLKIFSVLKIPQHHTAVSPRGSLCTLKQSISLDFKYAAS